MAEMARTRKKRFTAGRPIALLMLILVLGLFVRLALVDNEGHGSDLRLNQTWARSAAELGLAQSYVEQLDGGALPNYPPFSIMMFAGAGHLYKAFFAPDSAVLQPQLRRMVKLPAIGADLLTCIFLYGLLAQWRSRKVALTGALLYALHPAVIHNSAVWGQTDAIYTLFAVAAFYALLHRESFTAGGFGILSLLTKPQGVIFFPLLLFLVRLRVKDILLFAVGLVVVLGLVLVPFVLGGTLDSIITIYIGAVDYYPTLSLNAYNLWWGLFADAAGSTSDADFLFGLMSYRNVGIMLFALVYGLIPLRFWHICRGSIDKKDHAETCFLLAGLVALAFFVLNTQMHERYMFPFLAFGLPLVFVSSSGAWLYGLISLAFLFNQLGVLPYGSIDRAIFAEFPLLDGFIAVLQVVLLFAYIRFLWPRGKWITHLRRA